MTKDRFRFSEFRYLKAKIEGVPSIVIYFKNDRRRRYK